MFYLRVRIVWFVGVILIKLLVSGSHFFEKNIDCHLLLSAFLLLTLSRIPCNPMEMNNAVTLIQSLNLNTSNSFYS